MSIISDQSYFEVTTTRHTSGGLSVQVVRKKEMEESVREGADVVVKGRRLGRVRDSIEKTEVVLVVIPEDG